MMSLSADQTIGFTKRPGNGTAGRAGHLSAGFLTSSPAASSWGSGQPGRPLSGGSDKALYHMSFNGTTGRVGRPWAGFSARIPQRCPGVPIDRRLRPGQRPGPVSKVVERKLLERLALARRRGPSRAIGAASCSVGHLDVYILGSDNAVWHLGYNGTWAGWQRLGGSWTSGPSAVCPSGSAYVSVFVRAPTWGLWQSKTNPARNGTA